SEHALSKKRASADPRHREEAGDAREADRRYRPARAQAAIPKLRARLAAPVQVRDLAAEPSSWRTSPTSSGRSGTRAGAGASKSPGRSTRPNPRTHSSTKPNAIAYGR